MGSTESQDKFQDNTFSYQDWSAETLKSTDEVQKHMKGLDIIGHQITDIRVVGGYASDFLERNFSETVCDFACNLTYTERKGINPYVWHDPYALFPQTISVDDPIIITLDNGNQIEIGTVQSVGVIISKNRIPQGLQSTSPQNFNSQYFFSDSIGKRIIDFEAYIPEEEQADPITKFFIWDAYYRFILEDGTKLELSDSWDWTVVKILDSSNTPIKIPLWKFEKSAIPELDFDNYRIGGANEECLSEHVWKIIDSLEYPAKPYPTLEERAQMIQLAQNGDAEAQFQLGYFYFAEVEKHGVVMYEWAYEWLLKAANQNHPKALFKLAYLFDCGPKEWRNKEQAIQLYDRASKCGHEHAADYLELMDDQELVKKVLGKN